MTYYRPRPDKYILDGKIAIPAPNLFAWGEWFETANRRVARDKIGQAVVSTMFWGFDHNYSGVGEPMLFETMILFDGCIDEYCERYATWYDAEDGHERACEVARKAVAKMPTCSTRQRDGR